MGSFGMDWSHKGAVLWDWGNSPPIGAFATENPKNLPQVDPELAGFDAPAGQHESVHSSCGTFSSSSELGYCSSKSSLASIDSLRKIEDTMKLNFATVKVPDKNSTGKKAEADEARSSPPLVVPISSGEPVIGLKLGKRTYFEDGCGGQSAVTTPAAASTKKVKVAHSAQNPYCQVEGCKVDLSSAKEYHRKHKVCEPHTKFPKVVVAGLERRFCQQCSRFHALSEFDQKKRSCRRRLNDHNARRRKPHSEAISFGAPSLPAMFYDVRQQKSFLLTQAPYDQMISCASFPWDNNHHPVVGGFKFAETKAPWLKPMGTISFDGQQVWNSVVPITNGHHDFDGFLIPFKGTRATKVLHHQGVEASAAVSDMNGHLDLHRARSLLSNGSADDAASNQAIIPHHLQLQQPGLAAAIAGFSSSNKPPVVVAQQGSPATVAGLWQDDQPRFQQAFDPLLGAVAAAPHHQFHHLLKPTSYDSSSGLMN